MTKTVHPRINTTFEKSIKSHELQLLLTTLQDAIRDGDHKKLYKLITKVATGVSDFASSRDVFIKKVDIETPKISKMKLTNKN